jgi:hypothetical protein
MKATVMRGRWLAPAILLLIGSGIATRAQVPGQIPGVRYYSGQNVVPVFEGWEKNADGSFTFVFGYLNRNYEEEPEIPIGSGNSFSPGAADRGQPTHFYPRRQQFMFKVGVPADFGSQELTWTLTRNGRTEKAVAHLALEWELTEIVYSQNRNGLARDSVTALPNKAPTITAEGPAKMSATAGAPATLSVSAGDDGVPKPPDPQQGARGRGGSADPPLVTTRQGPVQQAVVKPSRTGLAVTWTHWRGPGKVVFNPQTVVVKDGKASTQAIFSSPGTYVVRAYADDGVLMTEDDVTVAVASSSQP